MCRWVGYYGAAIRPEELVYEPEHSLFHHQSRASKLYKGGLNGDGLGLGWYSSRDGTHEPGIYRNAAPAWADRNLQQLCHHIEAELFIAHIRATTGTAVQQTNCHPFRYGRWLFVHNGFLKEYERVRRELLLAITPTFFDNIEGSTDSELLFHLALSFGLDKEPLPALERMAGFVEALGAKHGIAEPLQMTLGLSDGERLYAVRYASGKTVNSLFVSEDVDAIRALYPESERIQHFARGARAIVSEPLGSVEGTWREVPTSTALIVGPGHDELVPFVPRMPARA
jgi:glutamine amidotransferase